MITRHLAALVALLCFASCHGKKNSASQLDAARASVNLGSGPLPPTLSETGLFPTGDIGVPGVGVQAYDVRVPLWSDGAQKDRFVFLPQDQAISFDASRLNFPPGSVLVKHFKSDNDPGLNIETRIIVLNADGTWTFGTYAWNDDGSTELLTRSRTVNKGGKDYRIPSPRECTSCHASGAEVLGFVPAQLKTPIAPPVTPLVDVRDTNVPLEQRVRTYMQVNCSVCHRPGGLPGADAMDMRLEAQDTHLLSLGKIMPGNPEASILFQKISADTSRMPPVSIRPDPLALELFRAYIQGMEEQPAIGDTVMPNNDPAPDPEDESDPSVGQNGGLRLFFDF